MFLSSLTRVGRAPWVIKDLGHPRARTKVKERKERMPGETSGLPKARMKERKSQHKGEPRGEQKLGSALTQKSEKKP